jgi:citrate synthase
MVSIANGSENSDLPDFMPAKKVLDLLGIKDATLYSYVARGLIRAVSQPGTRQKLYSRDDVDRLALRSLARSGHGPVAASAMRWGEPIIPSSVTEITAQGPRYRGRLVSELARSRHSFESTVELLWSGVWSDTETVWQSETPPPDYFSLVNGTTKRCPKMHFYEALSMAIHLLAIVEGGNPEVHLGFMVRAARQLMQVAAGAFGYLAAGEMYPTTLGETLAGTVLRTLGHSIDEDARHLVDTALVMSADHELAPSTFSARIAASAGASLHACIIAAIAAFDGARTGIGADLAEDFFHPPASTKSVLAKLSDLREAGKRVPGFNHPLYVAGDPRADYLLARIASMQPPTKRAKLLLEVVEQARHIGIFPSLPVALVGVQFALNLPARSAGALFLLGRLAGWIAHVQEQRLAGYLLRPRAKAPSI